MLLFFFSSRRRHTRSLRDWSSDVCSSDLPQPDGSSLLSASVTAAMDPTGKGASELLPEWLRKEADGASRSEERRVGKEYRTRWSTDQSIRKSGRNTWSATPPTLTRH